MTTYQKMCSKLKELQELWEPKVGHCYVSERDGLNYIDQAMWRMMEFVPGGPMRLTKEALWLPSQEDLWELLPSYEINHLTKGPDGFQYWDDFTNSFVGDTAQQALLQAVAWERWQKKWNGEEWI